MIFFPRSAVAEGIEWVIMSYSGHWLCHSLGRWHVPSGGDENCGSSQDDLNTWTNLQKVYENYSFWNASMFIQFSWVSIGWQKNPTSLTLVKLKIKSSVWSKKGSGNKWVKIFYMSYACSFPVEAYLPLYSLLETWSCFPWKNMLKQKSQRTTVLHQSKGPSGPVLLSPKGPNISV